MLVRSYPQVMRVLVAVFIIPTVFLQYAAGQQSCTTLNRRPGECIPPMECKFVVQMIRLAPKPLPIQVIQYLRNARCGTSNERPIVCCEKKPLNLGTGNATPWRQTSEKMTVDPKEAHILAGVDPTSLLSRIGMQLLETENECSVEKYYVYRGMNAVHSGFKWMVLLIYDDGVTRTMECSGSLITDQHVLTAAHCIRVHHTKKLVAARLGEYDTESDIDCPDFRVDKSCAEPVQEIDIETGIYHQDFNPTRFSDDIGLLRLRTKAILNSSVRTICLPIRPSTIEFSPSTLFVAGWGEIGNGKSASILQEAEVPILDNDRCRDAYKIIPITDKHMCAGGVNGTQSCKGDSGGPLFKIFLPVQYGIVSGGATKCGAHDPGIYTRVLSYIPWISSNIALLT